jgi:hypothetical protein
MARKQVTENSSIVSSEGASAAPIKKHHTTRTKSTSSKAPRKAKTAEVSEVSEVSDVPEVSKPVEVSTPAVAAPDHDAVARLAYSYWLERGGQGGSAVEDWARAEAALRAKA